METKYSNLEILKIGPNLKNETNILPFTQTQY